VTVTVSAIQTEAFNLFKRVKEKNNEVEEMFNASFGRFDRFKN
jgi:hypothetical protein